MHLVLRRAPARFPAEEIAEHRRVELQRLEIGGVKTVVTSIDWRDRRPRTHALSIIP